ncbi:hypothetical protein G6F65_021694 [Rhizopus arrhizus]|nr:hypothetical protein G6F65_021694 [Rhizopus arrhizus]
MPWSSKLVLNTACAWALCVASREKRSANSASSCSVYSYWKRPDEAVPDTFQAAALRPCKRSSVSSGWLLSQTAGTVLSKPWGASTTVCTTPRSRSNASVSAVAAGVSNQLRCRNSTEIRCSSMRRAHSATCARPRASRRIQGGNWKCTAPSLPGIRSGSSAIW